MRSWAPILSCVIAACSTPDPGQFLEYDCRGAPNCLKNGRPLAAGASIQLDYFTTTPDAVNRIVSTDPGVVEVGEIARFRGDTLEVVLWPVAPGMATIEVRGDDLINQLPVAVATLDHADIVAPARLVSGGHHAITSAKYGVDGTELAGRGGYQITAPPELTVRRANKDTNACLGQVPDYLVSGGEPGTFLISAPAVAPGWTGAIEVIPPAAVVGVAVRSKSKSLVNEDDFVAVVVPVGKDAAGNDVEGVQCDWTSSLPVPVSQVGCYVVFRMSPGDRVDLTCTFDGRVLGTLSISDPW